MLKGIEVIQLGQGQRLIHSATKQRYREKLKLIGDIGDSYFLWESSSPLVSYRSHHAVDWQE